jgi:hypothetical protein
MRRFLERDRTHFHGTYSDWTYLDNASRGGREHPPFYFWKGPNEGRNESCPIRYALTVSVDSDVLRVRKS